MSNPVNNYAENMPRMINAPATPVRRLTDKQLRDAIHTVRVRSTGKNWAVKKVADPKVWRFDSREKALGQAMKLAKEASWGIIILDRIGRIRQILPAPAKDVSKNGEKPVPASRSRVIAKARE